MIGTHQPIDKTMFHELFPENASRQRAESALLSLSFRQLVEKFVKACSSSASAGKNDEECVFYAICLVIKIGSYNPASLTESNLKFCLSLMMSSLKKAFGKKALISSSWLKSRYLHTAQWIEDAKAEMLRKKGGVKARQKVA